MSTKRPTVAKDSSRTPETEARIASAQRLYDQHLTQWKEARAALLTAQEAIVRTALYAYTITEAELLRGLALSLEDLGVKVPPVY